MTKDLNQKKAEWKEFPLSDDDLYREDRYVIENQFIEAGTTREEVIIRKLVEDKERLARLVYSMYQRIEELEKAVDKHEDKYDHSNLENYRDW